MIKRLYKEEDIVDIGWTYDSWDEIKNYIIKNYYNFNKIIFYNPDNKKESMIIPKKYGINYLKNMSIDDLKRIIIY